MNIPSVVEKALVAASLDVDRIQNALDAWIGQQLHGVAPDITVRVRVGKLPSHKSQMAGKYQKASVARTIKEKVKNQYCTPIHRFASWICDIETQQASGITFDNVILPNECTNWLAKFGDASDAKSAA